MCIHIFILKIMWLKLHTKKNILEQEWWKWDILIQEYDIELINDYILFVSSKGYYKTAHTIKAKLLRLSHKCWNKGHEKFCESIVWQK